MPHRATPRRTGHLLPLAVADALWAELMANSVFPAGQAFTGFPADPQVGYVLLGARAVPTVKGVGGRWHVQEADVRRAAEELRAVRVSGVGLVRVAPFRGSLKAGQREGPALRWRQRLGQEWARARVDAAPGRLLRGSDHLPHLAGIDWRRSLMERTGAEAENTWWLPRTLVKVLDAAEHAEERWLLAARTCQRCGSVADQPEQWRVQAGSSWQTICPGCRTTTLRPYNGELEGHVYSVLSKKRASLEVSGWRCAVCQEAPAFAVDHCHEHGYVRAPFSELTGPDGNRVRSLV
ncbi:endonuclease domain-containing protein [Kitasatospora sp. NPDC001175]|uniref:endonuclease domain-containing protein n=1 Tax=Kitasatospora sp. NPDC001175 TaxID=3157103 RepID=UPI003D05DAC9